MASYISNKCAHDTDCALRCCCLGASLQTHGAVRNTVKLSDAAFWYKIHIAAAAAAAEQARELQLLRTAQGFMNSSMIGALPMVWAETDINQAWRDEFDQQQMFNATCLCSNVTELLYGTIGYDSTTYQSVNCSGVTALPVVADSQWAVWSICMYCCCWNDVRQSSCVATAPQLPSHMLCSACCLCLVLLLCTPGVTVLGDRTYDAQGNASYSYGAPTEQLCATALSNLTNHKASYTNTLLKYLVVQRLGNLRDTGKYAVRNTVATSLRTFLANNYPELVSGIYLDPKGADPHVPSAATLSALMNLFVESDLYLVTGAPANLALYRRRLTLVSQQGAMTWPAFLPLISSFTSPLAATLCSSADRLSQQDDPKRCRGCIQNVTLPLLNTCRILVSRSMIGRLAPRHA